uniref:Dehydrogenase/reductase SDR family member 7 n=1 Tax=Spermophilus dauricus TaxID=99837 RepID=A0A8C9QB60_SPEDA
ASIEMIIWFLSLTPCLLGLNILVVLFKVYFFPVFDIGYNPSLIFCLPTLFLPQEQELTGLVVWVTGASSGIGEELAYQLSKLGVSLVLSARRVHELERVKRKCLGNGNLKEKDIFVLPFDLANRSSHEVATKAVLQEFGRIDVLVNNAGKIHSSLIVDTKMDFFKELIELNYLGTVSLTKCVLPHMIERKQGKIVIVNSLVSFVPIAISSGYCASKHALRGFIHSLQIELTKHPGIIVSNICPGPVHSNIRKNALTEEVTKTVDHNKIQDRQMATRRCVRLMLVAMANNLKEVWIGEQPYLLVSYLWQYMPTLAWWIIRKFWEKRIDLFKSGVVRIFLSKYQ